MASGGMISRILAWSPTVAIILSFGGLIPAIWLYIPDINLWFAIFCTIFVLRYTRFFGHIIGHYMYRPSPIAVNPQFDRSDVTVVIPTVDPSNPDFMECIRSIMANQPAHIMVVTVGAELKEECRRILLGLVYESEGTALSVSAVARPSKRQQIAHIIPEVRTSITILADDHVFWPSRLFIPSILAPFENERVAVVATSKRVRRTPASCKFAWSSIVNFLAQNYLERHNWELRSSNALDGGVFVVSGRTAAYTTDFLYDTDLLTRYCNEKFFFGLLGNGGLQPDDDNFLTREVMKKRLLIRFQDTEDATVETTLGVCPQFTGQLLRWARTTFRSNPVMLRDPSFLFRYTWSALMVYWAGIMNFAIVWDGLLIATLVFSLKADDGSVEFATTGWLVVFVMWLLTTKIVKILPALLRHPSDCFLIPAQIAFAYVHSFYKLWALLTFWNCGWSRRRLDDINDAENGQAGISLDDLGTIEINV